LQLALSGIGFPGIGATGECTAAPYSQQPYSQGGYSVDKLTRAFALEKLGAPVLRDVASAKSFAYRDPDTNDRVSVLVVLDPAWSRVVYTTSYQGETEVKDFGGFGTGDTDFSSPSDMDMDSAGRLYVADAGNNRIVSLGWIANDLLPLLPPAQDANPCSPA